MTILGPTIQFETDISEDELVEEFRSGVIRSAVDKAAKYVTNKSVKAFDKLYSKVGVVAPSWNATRVETLELLCVELKEREYNDIGRENKDFFLVHLYSNVPDLYERAQEQYRASFDNARKAILENLVAGLDSKMNSKERIERLQTYFNLFPMSDHFRANLVYAEALLEAGQKRECLFHAKRAFHAVPYDRRGLALLSRIDPSDTVIMSIKSILNCQGE